MKEHILQKYNVEAIIVNDVELALSGERERGVRKKTDEYCLHKIRKKALRQGQIVDGYLLKGNNMAAGELGYYLESLEEMTDEFVCPGRFEKRCVKIFSQNAVKKTACQILFCELNKVMRRQMPL